MSPLESLSLSVKGRNCKIPEHEYIFDEFYSEMIESNP